MPLRPHRQYGELEVELKLGVRVQDLGLERKTLTLENGQTIAWDRLCIATGSTARSLPGGFVLRNLDDADRLRAVLDAGASLDILGAGLIGCEVAAVAAARGLEVRMYELLEQPMVRIVGAEVGAYLASVHREHGVELHLNVNSPDIDHPFLAAAGSVPQIFEADQAGLEIDRGIVVDEFGHTSHGDVFAAGDVARFFHPLFERRIRVEHFQTSQRQGFAVGRVMAGAAEPYSEVPWFWSDQYDLNLQYAGAGLSWDEIVVRGELGRPPFTVFYLAGGSAVGVLGVNDHHTVARARHAMQRRAGLTRLQLEDPSFDLRRA